MADSQSTSARATFHLPIEITLDILSRLPVKCLLRCKSVCKTWETNVYEEWNELVQICGSSAAAVVLNGVFYWPVHLLETDQVGVMSFNMGDEVFRKIRIPEGLDIIWYKSNWRFTELYDELALVVVSPDQTGFRVWVLNENETSWTNQVNVDAFPMIATGMRSGEVGKITVAGGGKNGELFVIAHKESGDLKLFAYDPKTRETKDLCSCQVPYASCVYLYTGTLLPVMQANEVVLVYKNKKMKH